MKRIPHYILPALLFALLISCAAPLRQFYPDTYFAEDRLYENKPLRFIMQFQGNWLIYTDPNDMTRDSRALARAFAKSGVELLFVGATAEGLHGTRGIAVNFNEPAPAYAARIRELNRDDIRNDKGLTEFLDGSLPMIKWVYDKGEFRFAEFFFAIGTYDIRIAFWTRHALFDRFLPVFESTMASLQATGGLR